MRYYILDDAVSIVKVLGKIVEDYGLGEVVGSSTNPEEAVEEIIYLQPDIVLIDYLMPVMDGISAVKKIKEMREKTVFVMISQVSEKDMVAAAYSEGIEFFIHKPVNLIEVKSVLSNVNEKIRLQKTLGGIREMIQPKQNAAGAGGTEETGKADRNQRIKEIKYLLSILGMLGEHGTGDIVKICEYSLEGRGGSVKECVNLYCEDNGGDMKMIKQRMRRAVKKGLANMAAMGVEDYYNETFQNYCHTVFEFESIRAEMDFIRGKRNDGGKVNVDKFIEGLIVYSEVKL
ncbi:MAG: DNA-binding domain-containing protein [Anaerovoracaceae bacterium]